MLISILIITYLIGSIPFGLILAKFFGIGDIRKKGSGNIGATNVARLGGLPLGALTVLLDAGKGFLAIYLTNHLASFEYIQVAFVGIIFGHVFSVFLKFNGGKGVATFFGCLLALTAQLFIIAIVSWLAMYALKRISALSALTMLLVVNCYCLVMGIMPALILVVSAIIVIRHESNIKQLYK